MARRVIATAEVQVAADVKQAEAGLEGLTDTFRQIGQVAERAAAKAEAAFFGGATTISRAFGNAEDAVLGMIQRLERGNAEARMMALEFGSVAASISRAQQEGQSLQASTQQMLNLLRQVSASAGLFEANLENADKQAKKLLQASQEIEGAIRSAEIRAGMLEQAFRDVGQTIDLVMAGGLEGLQDDILDTIRRLEDMGGEFREVGVIGERALNDIRAEMNSADVSTEQVVTALMRLERQLREVAVVGDSALEELDNDARQAAKALGQMARQADRADRSLDSIGRVSRRTSGDVRGLVGLLGAAGLGYAAASTARWGLEMTQQIEKSSAAFLGLTGSVEGANAMLQKMIVFARETPYNLASVTEAAAQLLAVGDGFGVTASNVDRYLETFGNAITMTGGSEDQFIRIVRVLGQMSSTGKVLGQDMNQLAQNLPGYNVWEALADGADTSVQELRRLQDIGKLDELLTGNEAVQILIDGMSGIPGAAGAMERRMNTLGGAIEKFKETTQLAVSQGLEPFSETLQDTLKDPVILNATEDLANAFGSLLSTGLEAIAPELDDLAVAAQNFIGALEEFAPAAGQVVDSLGDLLNFLSPLVSGLGKATSAVLDFGGGMGKLGVAAAAFAAGGPIGIAAGVLFGVSGAMDLFTSKNEEAANMARLLAAAQTDVNTAMMVGEEVVYSEAQQLAINTANELRDTYGELYNTMAAYGVTVTDLQSGMSALAGGVGTVTPELQRMIDTLNNPDIESKATGQFEAISEEYRKQTDVITEEAQKQADALVVAGVEEIGAQEEKIAALQELTEIEAANWEMVAQIREDAAAAAAETSDEWGELDEDRVEALKGILEDEVEAFREWEEGINSSTDGAAISLSGLAEEYDNNAQAMIQAINDNNAAVFGWKNNIVQAAVGIQESMGLSDEEAQSFMGTLGELGVESAPALAAMLEDFRNGGTQLQEFFNATQMESAVMATNLTDAFDDATGSVPTLVEELDDGTLTIEGILQGLPEAMEAAGMDMETVASNIDLADEMGDVGDNAVSGLVNALNSPAARARVRTAANSLAGVVTSSTVSNLKVKSPSKVFYEIGEFVVEGLVLGIQSKDAEAYAVAAQTASMIGDGFADYFKDADNPQEEARKFAQDIADSIVDELIAEQEAVADAAEALAEAAADRLDEAWDRVKDRFTKRDLKEGVSEAVAELDEAKAELAAAESLAGAGGQAALAAGRVRVTQAQQALDQAQALLAEAQATDAAADLWADDILIGLRRRQEDAARALSKTQSQEIEDIQGRISAANRNLDPAARAKAEEELKLAEERHEAETIALQRQQEDEERFERQRYDNENEIRELQVKAIEDQVNLRERELGAFEDALEDIVDSIADAIESLPGLRENVSDSQRDLQDSYLDQFEDMLDNIDNVSLSLLRTTGLRAGLSRSEVDDLIKSAQGASSAAAGADAANLGTDQLVELLSTGLYTIGANGGLGIAAGLNSAQQAIAEAMFGTVQQAINSTLGALEISSPSKLTQRLIGEPMAEGIASGLMLKEKTVSKAMTGLLDNVINGTGIPSSQLVNGLGMYTDAYRGPLVTMPGAIIQDSTDADLVAQRVAVALSATGVQV